MNITDALNNNETFTREQVAWLMSQSMRWGHELGYEEGYEAGQRDELALAGIAAAYAYTGTFNAEVTWREGERRKRRQQADAEVRELVRRTAVTAGRPLSAQPAESAA